jgi:hypothetical protein
MDPAGDHKAEDTTGELSSAVRELDDTAGHDTLKYSLLGPSLTKAGQDAVDQRKVRDIRRDDPCFMALWIIILTFISTLGVGNNLQCLERLQIL